MSNAGPATLNNSTLCRCGRTTSLADDKVRRQRLSCGHYICPDCWHLRQPLPAPICGTCIIALQHNELELVSTMYNDLSKKFNELNSVHNKAQSAYSQLAATYTQKQAEHLEQITKFKNLIMNGLGKGHPTPNTSQSIANTSYSTANTSYSTANTSYSTANTSHPQVQPRAQPQAPPQAIHGARNVTSPPVSGSSIQRFDWNSDEGKRIGAFFSKNKQEMNTIKTELRTTQGERETLKQRIVELTSQLEAKSKADADTMTAIDKAELLEAELEDLNARLDKCESDLEAARTELAELKARNAELESENEKQKDKLDSDQAVMEEAKSSLASLHQDYQKLESKLAESRAALKAKHEALSSGPDTSRTSVDSPASEKVLGKRPEVQSPTPADWKKSATTITALQKEVWKLRQEKAALEKELSDLKQRVQVLEEENSSLGKKLHSSADVASELSKLHIAANERSASTESKLRGVEGELKRAKELIVVREREKRDLEIAARAAELARQAEFATRIKSLEAEIAELVKARDAALAQIDDWEENRGMWKRWGESMALRAKQWQEEAQKARKPRIGETILQTKVELEEPPPLTPPATTTMRLSPVVGGDPGHTRKRPHDMPDTDVDRHCDVAQYSSDDTIQPRPERVEGEGSGRKKARFEDGETHR